MSQKTAIIIGAGYAGMALAVLLGKKGYKVTVFEKNTDAGGRIAVTREQGYTFDLGPSWYLMPEVFEQFYNLFGEIVSERLELKRLSPGYKVFFESHDPVVIFGDTKKDASTFDSIEPGAGGKLERYVAGSTEAYDLSLEHFLYNNKWGIKGLLRWDIIRRSPRMLGLLSKNLDRHVGGYFGDLRLRQILEYHSVFLGSSPFQAPAIYSLMSHLDFKSGIYYPGRGMPSLVDDLLDMSTEYDISFRFDSPVETIMVEDGLAVGVQLEGGNEVRADVVISNADLHFTETRLLPRSYQSFPEPYWDMRQPGPGAFLISLGVRGELPELLHHNLYFVEDWKGNFDAIYASGKIPDNASVYVCNPTKTDPSLAPLGHENLFILVPIPAGVNLSEDQQQVLARDTIQALQKATGISDLSDRITTQQLFGPADFADKFNAWQFNAFGGESHLLKQSILFRTPNKSKKVKNLYYVGSGTVPGIGLPMCLIGAQLVYKRIIGITRPGPLMKGDLE